MISDSVVSRCYNDVFKIVWHMFGFLHFQCAVPGRKFIKPINKLSTYRYSKPSKYGSKQRFRRLPTH